MKNVILFVWISVFGPLLVLKSAFSQEELGPYYEISTLFHQRANHFSCEFVQTQIDQITLKSDESLQEDLNDEAKELARLSEDLEDEEQKKNIQLISLKMQEVSKGQSAKHILKKGLEKLCRGSVKPLVLLSRGGALANSALLSTAAFPLTGLVSFWNGVFSRKKNELGARKDFIYRAFGPKRNLSAYLFGLMGSEALSYLISPNPAFTALNASVAIEMITNYRCFHVNEKDAEQVKFCQTYSKLKDLYHKGHQKSFELGHWLQVLIDEKIIQKRADFPNDKFCQFSKKKQVRLARRVIQRHSALYQDERIKEIHTLLPIHKNTCTKILFYTDSDERVTELTNEKKYLEGIELVVLRKGVFPKEFYYSTTDLKAMTFENSLCYEAESLYYGQYLTNKLAMTGDLLKSSLASEILAKPSTSQVVMPDELIRSGDVKSLRNLIFSIGNNEQDELGANGFNQERKEIVKRIKDDYRKTINSGSFDRCREILAKRNVDLKEFEQDLFKINQISQEKSLQKQLEFEVIEKLFKKEKRHLKLNWELIRTNNLQIITNALKAKDVANIIIISHGKSSGHLVDSEDQELPREAFNQISPSIQSLNFYSCYSKKLIDLYSLKDKIGKLPSFYKIRYLTSVSENDFMGETNLAPMAAFGYYLSQVDTHLSRSMKGANLLQEKFSSEFKEFDDEKTCRLDTSNLFVKKGSYALTLNEEMIGTIEANHVQTEMLFPCRALKFGANVLKIKNIINSGGSIIENLSEFQLNLEGVELTKSQSSIRMNSMVIFKFSWQN